MAFSVDIRVVSKSGDPLLTYDQAVICLEDQLNQPIKKKTWSETMRECPRNYERLRG